MFVSTKAIVLRSVQYSDSKLIVTLFTLEDGLLAAMYQVGKRSSKRSLLEPFSLVELTLKRGQGSLYFIREISPLRFLNGIATGAEKRLVAMAMAEVVYRTLKESHKDEALFDFLEFAICRLNQFSGNAQCFVQLFLLEYAKNMGVYPNLDSYSDGAVFDTQNGIFVVDFLGQSSDIELKNSLMFFRFLKEDFYSIEEATYSKSDIVEISGVISRFLECHLPEFRYIKSIDFLNELI